VSTKEPGYFESRYLGNTVQTSDKEADLLQLIDNKWLILQIGY
jgi:hypothetical protein